MVLKLINHISLTLATFFLLSCGSDDHTSPVTSSAYYACDDDLVINIEQNGTSMFAAIFNGKEMLMGRDLVRDSISESDLFSANDLSITLLGNNIEVNTKNLKISNCYLSKSEMERRGNRDIYHYISNNGSLITTRNLRNGRIQFNLKTGQSVILDTILPQVRAASGTKYQQGDIMFWVQQNTAMLVYEGVLYGHCVLMFEDEFTSSACTDTALHTGVVAFLKQELIDDIAFIPESARKYYAEQVDINDDGKEEVFIALTNSYFCGSGGCSWYLLNPDFTLIEKFTVSDFPIYLSTSKSNGYHDLYVRSDGEYHALKFNNGYPSNPSVEPVYDIFGKSEYTTGGTRRILEWAYLKTCLF